MPAAVVFTAEMDARLRQMCADKAGMGRIAEQLGVSPSTVAKRINELGLPTRGSGGWNSRL